ncbi:hypothetical protein ScPMuIL_005123, partial [Solemya velum]
APRWNLPKADWTKFQNLCEDRLSHFTVKDDQDPIEIFTSVLHDVATEAIPKTSSTCAKFKKPWFTDECKDAISERKRALRLFKLCPTADNLNSF